MKHLILHRREATFVSPASKVDLPDLGLSVSIQHVPSETQMPLKLSICCLLAAPPLLLPADKDAVSPAYLFHTDIDLPIEFSVHIQHFVMLYSIEDCNSMQFLATSCVRTETAAAVYEFGENVRDKGRFKHGDCVGELTINDLGLFVVAAPRKLRGKCYQNSNLGSNLALLSVKQQ